MSRAEQKAKTRENILATARTLFIEKGFAGTSIRDVAKTAGVGIGTIHVHFKNKKELLLSCFHQVLRGAVDRGLETLDREAPLDEQLTHLGYHLYESYTRHPALSREMFMASLFPEEEDELLDSFLIELANIFVQAKNRGEIRHLPAQGFRAAQGFFAAYLAILLGGLAGHFGLVEGKEAALRWAEALQGMLRLQLVGLGADETLLEEGS